MLQPPLAPAFLGMGSDQLKDALGRELLKSRSTSDRSPFFRRTIMCRWLGIKAYSNTTRSLCLRQNSRLSNTTAQYSGRMNTSTQLTTVSVTKQVPSSTSAFIHSDMKPK